MRQLRRHSVLEVILNTATGFVVSLVGGPFIYQLVLGQQPSLRQNFWIVWWFTLISIGRSYLWRRGFDWWQHRQPQADQLTGVILCRELLRLLLTNRNIKSVFIHANQPVKQIAVNLLLSNDDLKQSLDWYAYRLRPLLNSILIELPDGATFVSDHLLVSPGTVGGVERLNGVSMRWLRLDAHIRFDVRYIALCP